VVLLMIWTIVVVDVVVVDVVVVVVGLSSAISMSETV
jgi:hypothetical protein